MDPRERHDPAGFAERFHREFPEGASEWDGSLSRRHFIQVMGASIALATLSGCRLPQEKIVPYTDQPEKIIPGKPLHFATTLQVNGHPRGAVVTSFEGRPTHIAGNSLHPMSGGANDIWTGASVLELYDPDRLQFTSLKGGPTTWDTFTQAVTQLSDAWAATGGADVAFLTGPVSSPTLARLLRQFLAKFPRAKWHVHEPLEEPGLQTATGEPIEAAFDLTNADIIFALESDFLFDRPDSLALTRDFSLRRRPDDAAQCNRLYVAESCPTITGAKADHRFMVSPADFTGMADALLAVIQGHAADPRWPWLGALAHDLRQHPGRCLLIGGRALPAAARRALAAANAALGNVGKTVTYRTPFLSGINPAPLADLVSRLRANEVKTLIILGGNPVYDAPADFEFGKLLDHVPTTILHTLYANETAAHCGWVIHAAHDLESWGDARTTDGTNSICQPLIAPLYDGKSALELLSVLIQAPGASGHDLVRETWSGLAHLAPDAFEAAWHQWLRDGVISSLPVTPMASAPMPDMNVAGIPPAPATAASSPHGPAVWLAFRPSAALWDGRHANSGWLQELADPITKLTWDNAALFSPATAKRLGIENGDTVKLTVHSVSIEAPVLIAPGHADNCITLPLGYGRTHAGSVGNGVGFNAYLLRRSDALWQTPLEAINRTGRTQALARTQEHFRVQGRDLLHVARIDEHPPAVTPKPPEAPVPSLYPKVDYSHVHAWAMTIDLNTCIGCNACIIACQSENNIPVVGKEQVLFSREMQWIRVDRYFEGPEENPRAHFQPVPCMQCENAPCEVVCPVAATQHDDEGLNVMVYNRCVGTRYCSNNCPYKVRRFNFLFYNDRISPTRALQLNPNVTVRSRGVMEKCTYCVQRIEEARIAARLEHRPLRGGDIVTACQAACPARAIVFGDLNEPESAVAKNRRKPGHYAMLADLDTRPRTTYLEKKINPNSALEPRPAADPAREGI